MMNLRKPIAGITILALSACMGGGEDGDDTIVSSGLLELTLPDQASRDQLPSDLSSFIDDVEEENERADVNLTPTGDINYDGDFAIGFEGSDAIIVGAAFVRVEINGTDIEYNFTPEEAFDAEGDPTVAGGFGGESTQTDGYFSGDLAGSIIVDKGAIDEQTFDVDGSINAVFGDNGTVFGELGGTVTGPENDEFSGIFLAFD